MDHYTITNRYWVGKCSSQSALQPRYLLSVHMYTVSLGIQPVPRYTPHSYCTLAAFDYHITARMMSYRDVVDVLTREGNIKVQSSNTQTLTCVVSRL